ncbi:hypothetical protein BDV12DRAFT_7144 [Aspergillus spectabilis]
MDGSLQVDRHQGLRSPKYPYRREASSNSEVSVKLEHYSRPSPSRRPISLGANSCVRRKANGDSADAQEWLHKSSELPSKEQSFSQDKSREGKGDLAGCEQSELSHQKRPSTNPPNLHDHMPKLDDIARRRSKSIGFSPRDSRIADLSVQLRARLSHAAARIEKKRQSQTSQFQPPAGFLQNNTSAPILSTEALPRIGLPLSTLEIDGQQLTANGSPSAPDVPAPSSPYPPDAQIRPSPVRGLYPPSQPDPQKHFGFSTTREYSPLGLAPPADIIPSRVNDQRRRPNPNISVSTLRHTPFFCHGRRLSQQELQIDLDVTLVPETPPLRPATLATLAPYNGLSENSQSSSMEQDAIETLLFMSSPGTSGYHSNSQNSLHDQDVMNIDRSASQSVQWPVKPNDSQSSSRQRGTGNLETQAGDEIDLMLDQMNSDSDDDANYTSNHSNAA